MLTWKWIPGFEGKYQVSKDGRLISYLRKFPREMNFSITSDGYVRIGLLVQSKPRRYKNTYLHRLVAICHVPGYSEGMQVDHIDRDRSNNHHSNLRWVNSVDNSANRSSYSIRRRRTTEEECNNILTEYASGCYTQKELGVKYDRAERTINRILNGKQGE